MAGWAEVDMNDQPLRKLRPIACAEVLIKFVETLFSDEQSADMLQAFEPHQVGCGTPDGSPLIVYTARTWADNLRAKSHPTAEDFEECIAGIDFEHAYGRAYRSACLRGCRKKAPARRSLGRN